MYKVTLRQFLCNPCCNGRARIVTYSEGVCENLIIQHAMCMHHIVICGPSSNTTFFPHYLINSNFKKEEEEEEVVVIKDTCVLNFSTNNSHSKKNWARYDQNTYIGVYVKYLLFLSDSIKTWIFLIDFWKIHKHRNSWKSVQWEPRLSMRTNGQTVTAFHNFVNMPN